MLLPKWKVSRLLDPEVLKIYKRSESQFKSRMNGSTAKLAAESIQLRHQRVNVCYEYPCLFVFERKCGPGLVEQKAIVCLKDNESIWLAQYVGELSDDAFWELLMSKDEVAKKLELSVEYALF